MKWVRQDGGAPVFLWLKGENLLPEELRLYKASLQNSPRTHDTQNVLDKEQTLERKEEKEEKEEKETKEAKEEENAQELVIPEGRSSFDSARESVHMQSLIDASADEQTQLSTHTEKELHTQEENVEAEIEDE